MVWYTFTVDKIESFFHSISSRLLDFVPRQLQNIQIEKQKDASNTNFATQVDTLTENIIVLQIKEKFPGDLVIAEEGSSSQLFTEKGRYWIIDPICGTSNMSRGVPLFCTNIAVIEDGQLVAACVIDYGRKEYVWSVGGRKIYCNHKKFTAEKQTSGIVIDVDLSALPYVRDQSAAHLKIVEKLIMAEKYLPVTYATSLGFLYCATGRVDAIISPMNHLWDVAASVFLIQQSGGTTSQLNGSPWSAMVSPLSLLAARNSEIHAQIMDLITN